MAHTHDDVNEAIWKSDAHVQHFVQAAAGREEKRAAQLTFAALLLPFTPEDEFSFLDVGAGTGAATKCLLSNYPRARGFLAEFSPQMMAEGKKALAEFEGRYSYVEFDLHNPDWPTAIPNPIDAVVSSQSIHHLPNERKKTLFQEIHERLRPGGWYLNIDPIQANNEDIEAQWIRVADKLDPSGPEKRAHMSHEQHAMLANHRRYLTDLKTQIGFVREAGFKAVDVYWRNLDQVIYGGYKG